MTRTTSPAGRKAIMQREGVRLTAYRDTKGIPTIGCGHVDATPPVARMSMTITMAECDALLSADLRPMERAVNATDSAGRLSQNAFDATVSLAFNIGTAAFSGSTVARRIANGDMQGAAHAFLLWDKPPELAGRRQAECAQFLTPDSVSASAPVSLPEHHDMPEPDQSAQVRALQTKLTAAGYPVKPDGDFGPATENAVKEFQSSHRLTVDGAVGPLTMAALDVATAAASPPVTLPKPSVPPIPSPGPLSGAYVPPAAQQQASKPLQPERWLQKIGGWLKGKTAA